jgi:hypothetical protein
MLNMERIISDTLYRSWLFPKSTPILFYLSWTIRELNVDSLLLPGDPQIVNLHTCARLQSVLKIKNI